MMHFSEGLEKRFPRHSIGFYFLEIVKKTLFPSKPLLFYDLDNFVEMPTKQ